MDIISDLPDHLIIHIISFLPTEEAVRTSLLSSRWKYIWKGINKIQLCFRSNPENFANLVDHILNNCSSANFVLFQLSCPDKIDLPRLNAWLRRALSLQTERLIFCIDAQFMGFPLRPLPECILQCSTLVFLYFDAWLDIRIPESIVCFPHLKSVNLSLIFPNQTSVLNQLLSSCPVLEELTLSIILDSDVCQKFGIFVPTLKKLSLFLVYEGHSDITEYDITIDAPKLEYLSIVDDSLSRFAVKNLSCVRDVFIAYEAMYLEDLQTAHINSLLELLKAVAATELLTFYYCTIDVLGSALSYTWPKFPHLKMLNMNFSDLSGWTCSSSVLHMAPNLKVLILDLDHIIEREPCSWTPPDEVPVCLLECIQVIGIKQFKGNQDSLPAIEYLLKNGGVLEHMMIGFYPYLVNEEVVEKLLMFPTASSTCTVQICQRVFFQTCHHNGTIDEISVWAV